MTIGKIKIILFILIPMELMKFQTMMEKRLWILMSSRAFWVTKRIQVLQTVPAPKPAPQPKSDSKKLSYYKASDATKQKVMETLHISFINYCTTLLEKLNNNKSTNIEDTLVGDIDGERFGAYQENYLDCVIVPKEYLK